MCQIFLMFIFLIRMILYKIVLINILFSFANKIYVYGYLLNIPFTRRKAKSASPEGSNTDEDSKTKLPFCDEDKLITFLAHLQAINPESIINISTFDDVDIVCRKIETSLDQIDTYLGTCNPPMEENLYMQLITGVEFLFNKLCVDQKFRKAFGKAMNCYALLHNDYEECLGPVDWVEDKDESRICDAYKKIADCYYIKSAKLCGIPAAITMKELVVSVINPIVGVRCPAVKSNPSVPDALPLAKGEMISCNLFFTISLVFFKYVL